MRTKRITLIYKITPTEVFPPDAKELARKDEWIHEIKKSVPSEYEYMQMKVTYEIFNPEVERLRRFFHTCVKYYAIQNLELTDREETPTEFQQYREEILDELLGYDYKTVHKTIRKRKSTSDYKTTQAWNTLLKNLEETIFDAAGYEFPVSEDFWETVKEQGYDRAQDTHIKKLQERMKKRKV